MGWGVCNFFAKFNIFNCSSSVQMTPHDITVKYEGYLLDMLRCFAVNTSPNKWPHYKCMITDRRPADKIH